MKQMEQLLDGIAIPRMHTVRNTVPQEELLNLPEVLEQSIISSGCLNLIQPGSRIAIATGSREIDHIVEILKTLVKILQSCGANSFIVPAMGSHGGANAKGQIDVLKGFGITEESIGVPIISSMETVPIGKNSEGQQVHIDKNAAGADWIIPVGRIKPHTNFRGSVESGLMKMMAVGLGKQHGAEICHRKGFEHMAETIFEHGSVILQNANILFGIGIVENRRHQISVLEVIPADKIPEREPELLEQARKLLGSLPFDGIDVLIVDEMGKDFCGLGMDPAITGRSGTMPVGRPYAKRLAVLDLTEKSHGNAAGVGLSDVITDRLFKKIDRESMYINGLTVGDLEGLRFPVIVDSDRLAIKVCMKSCMKETLPEKQKIVRIKNTMAIDTYQVSEAMIDEIRNIEGLELTGEVMDWKFDSVGNLF